MKLRHHKFPSLTTITILQIYNSFNTHLDGAIQEAIILTRSI